MDVRTNGCAYMDAGSHGCLDICLIDIYVLLCMYCYMHVLLCKLLGIHMLSSVLDIICLPLQRPHLCILHGHRT